MTGRCPIKCPVALNHGSTTLVVGADIKDIVHIEILIYHLILVIGSPFDNNIIILLIRLSFGLENQAALTHDSYMRRLHTAWPAQTDLRAARWNMGGEGWRERSVEKRRHGRDSYG